MLWGAVRTPGPFVLVRTLGTRHQLMAAAANHDTTSPEPTSRDILKAVAELANQINKLSKTVAALSSLPNMVAALSTLPHDVSKLSKRLTALENLPKMVADLSRRVGSSYERGVRNELGLRYGAEYTKIAVLRTVFDLLRSCTERGTLLPGERCLPFADVEHMLANVDLLERTRAAAVANMLLVRKDTYACCDPFMPPSSPL